MSLITNSHGPLSQLQQRLNYTLSNPNEDWIVFTENVPVWKDDIDMSNYQQVLIKEYAPSEGIKDLKQSIKVRDETFYKYSLSLENILVTNGSLQGLSLLLRYLYKPNKTILCQAPILGSISDILDSCGYNKKYISLNDLELDINKIKECNPDILYLNSPHNPTGNIINDEFMNEIVEFCKKNEVTIIADMIYDSYDFEEKGVYSPLSFNSNWKNIFTVNSMSKNYGAPGLRVGWITSDKENIEKLAGICEQECVSICGIAQKQAERLINRGNKELINLVNNGKEFIENYLNNQSCISFLPPEGGTQIFARLEVIDADVFADYLLENFHVAIATASNYSGAERNFIRIPLTYELDKTKSALELIIRGLRDFIRDNKKEV